MYTYAAVVVSVHDGDTITLNVDLGFDSWHRGPFRLLGCNARELAAPGGAEARDHLSALLPPGTLVTIRSVRADKYGERYDAAVTLSDGTDLVGALVAGQWAAAWSGAGTPPVPPWPRTVS